MLLSYCCWYCYTGDVVQEDDIIAQIETDKVTIDVKFTGKSGKITSLSVAEGDTVVVGQKVADFEEGDFGGGSSTAAAAASEPEPAAAAAPPPPPQQQQPAAAAPPPPPPPPPPKPQAAAAPKVGLYTPGRYWAIFASPCLVRKRAVVGASGCCSMLLHTTCC